MNTVFIYSLSDPRTNQIKYVGKTQNIKSRLCGHLHSSRSAYNKRLYGWIKELLRDKLMPQMEVLDIVDELNHKYWETYWICQIKSWGFSLFNLDLYGVHKKIKINGKIKRENIRRERYGLPPIPCDTSFFTEDMFDAWANTDEYREMYSEQ